MGLIESRLPGAFYTFALSVLTIILIVFFKTVLHLDLRQRKTLNTLLHASVGVMLASQSNVVTGKSIQFSDHFDMFANINLMICFYLVTYWKICTWKLPANSIFSALFRFTISLLIFAFSINSIIQIKEAVVEETTNLTSMLPKNLIFDGADGSRESFPIYADVALLYENGQMFYGYSDEDLLKRFYISSGCPLNLTKEQVTNVFGYRAIASKQKGERFRGVMARIGFPDLGTKLTKSLLEFSANQEKEMREELQDLKAVYGMTSCVDLARESSVEAVIFDETSPWKNVLISHGIEYASLPDTKFFAAKL